MVFVAARLPDRARRSTTASRSCSPPGSRSAFALQTFIIVGGVLRVIPLTGITLPFVSYGGSAWSRTSSRSPGCCSSPTARTRSERDEPADLPPRASPRSCCSASLIVATTYWQTWAVGGLADRQDNAIQRVAQFADHARADLRAPTARRCFADDTTQEGRRPDALLPHLPAARARRAGRRLLDRRVARAPGSSVDENDYLTASNTNLAHASPAHARPGSSGGTVTGNDLVLTLRPKAQRLALSGCSRASAAPPSR